MQWLVAAKTFSADQRPWRSFGPLLRLNEDVIAPGGVFTPHPHGNVEIITVMLSGHLVHEDDTGGRGALGPGDVQHMSAGAGILHSEANGSASESVHLLQLWVRPHQRGLTPGYAQHHVDLAASPGRWCELAGGETRLVIQQDVIVLGAALDGGGTLSRPLAPDSLAWLHVIDGEVEVSGQTLGSGDGLGVVDEPELALAARSNARVLLVLLQRVSANELDEQRKRAQRQATRTRSGSSPGSTNT